MNRPQRLCAFRALSALFTSGALATGLLTTTPTQAQRYRAVILHPAGFSESVATGIHNGRQVGYGSGPATGNNNHALLWSGSATGYTDLHPRIYSWSRALGVNNGLQVGDGGTENSLPLRGRALLWSGTAAGFADVTPGHFTSAVIHGIDNGRMVGTGINQTSGTLGQLWFDTLGNRINLADHNSGYDHSHVYAIFDSQQVGSADFGREHAMLWRDSTLDYTDLHRPEWLNSRAYGVADGQQVGVAELLNQTWHAILWSGNAQSAIDLNPNGFSTSFALGVRHGWQVGKASRSPDGTDQHAMLWRGAADRYLDIHRYLPNEFSQSIALGVDDAGNIVGTASNGSFRAVLWVAEPAAIESVYITTYLGKKKEPYYVGTVTLDGMAPVGGAQVTLSSSRPPSGAQLPSSVTIPEGATSVNFPFTPIGRAVITATYHNVSKTYTLGP